MSKMIQVEIVSAEQSIYTGYGKLIVANGLMGELGIAPEHTPLLTTLRPGEIRIIGEDDQEEFFYVSGGVLEVQPYKVMVLADTAVRARDLDEAAAEEAKKRAQQSMADRGADFNYSLVESELAAAVAQLRTIQHLRKKLGKVS